MITIRIATAAACLGLLGSGALAQEAAPPSSDPAGHAALAKGFIAGHFNLTAPDGTVVDSDDLTGKALWPVLRLHPLPRRLPDHAGGTVDGTRKTADERSEDLLHHGRSRTRHAEVLTQYMTSFDPRIVALTGTRASVEAAMANFGAIAQRVDQPGGGYAYGHTAAILLVNGDGLIIRRIAVDAGPEKIAEALTALAKPPADPARPAEPSRLKRGHHDVGKAGFSLVRDARGPGDPGAGRRDQLFPRSAASCPHTGSMPRPRPSRAKSPCCEPRPCAQVGPRGSSSIPRRHGSSAHAVGLRLSRWRAGTSSWTGEREAARGRGKFASFPMAAGAAAHHPHRIRREPNPHRQPRHRRDPPRGADPVSAARMRR